MLYLGIERIGELGVVECKGRIVRSEAAYTLREAVFSRLLWLLANLLLSQEYQLTTWHVQ